MNSLNFIFIFLLIISPGTFALEPSKISLTVKNGTLGDLLNLKVAEWRFDFDEDIYYSFNPTCPAGTCPYVPTSNPSSEAECATSVVPCDFTLTGSDCGRARYAVCEAYCSGMRPSYCKPTQVWTTLQINEESEVFDIGSDSDYQYFRVNWDRPCQGMRVDLYPLFGAPSVQSSPILSELDELTTCFLTSVPDYGIDVCPLQTDCYRYSTIFFQVKSYTPNSRYSIKVSAFLIEDAPRRTEPLPDAPPVVYGALESFLPHIKLNFSVPLTLAFDPVPAPTSAAYAFMLSTSYCGLLSVQAGYNSRPGGFDELAIFVATYYDLPNFPPPVSTMFPSDVANGFSFFLAPTNKIQICPPEGVPYGYVFFLVARLRQFTTTSVFTFGVDYERPGLVPPFPALRIGESSPTYSRFAAFPVIPAWYLAGGSLFEISCPNPAGGSPFTVSCRSGCVKFDCCDITWPALPRGRSLDPLNPLPKRFDHQFILPGEPSYQYTLPLSSRSFGVVLLLESNEPGNQVYGPLGPNWEDYLEQCSVGSTLAALSTIDGDWIRKPYVVPITIPACDYDDFLHLRDELASITRRFTNPYPTDSFYDLQSIRYRADSLLFADAWQACTHFVQQDILEPGPITLSSLPTIACPVEDMTDPCCNPSLTDLCCVPRSLSLAGELPSVIPDSLQCQVPECSTRDLNRYVSESILSEVGLCTAPPSQQPIYQFADVMVTFEYCLHSVYGDDFEGVTCYQDSDCPSLNGSRCDLLSHRCLGDLDVLNTAFLSCMYDNLRLDIVLAAAELQGWDLKDTPFVDHLRRMFAEDYCLQYEYGIQASEYRSYYTLFTNFPGCPNPPKSYLILGESTPGWATGRNFNGALCAYFYPVVMAFVTPDTCSAAEPACNWDASVSDETVCVSPASPATGDTNSFCGFCESSTSCHVVDAASPAECVNVGPVCALADGSLVTGMTADQCASTFSCNILCPGNVPCATETQCLQQGTCDDPELIYPLLDATYWAGSHSRTGFCTFPMPPLNSPDCAAVYPGSNPSSFGCVVFGRCVPVSAFTLSCTVDYDDALSCTSAMPGAKWFPRATSRATCETPVGCNDPQFFGPLLSATADITLFLTPKNQTECLLCAGTVQSANSWTPAKWLGGIQRPVSWLERAWNSPYRFAHSLNFREMIRFLRKASDYSLASQSLNTVQCFSVTASQSISRILCDCLSNGSASECFSASVLSPLGSGRVCPSSNVAIASPPFSMHDFVIPSDALSCATFSISDTSREYFNPVPTQSVTIAYRAKDKQLIVGTYESVRNNKNAVVGQAIGDCVTLSLSKDDAKLIERFTLCITVARGFQFLFDKYPVFDFGRPDFASRHAEPMNVAVVFDNVTGTLCGEVTLQGKSSSYLPIIRTADYQSKDGNQFTSSHRAVLYSVAAIYTILGVVLLVCLVRLITTGLSFSTPTNLLWFLFGFMIVMRSVYLYLVPSGVLNQPDQDQLLDYWFMDFPICLYLCANLLIGVIFAFIRLGKGRDDDTQLWMVVGLGSFLIIMLFIGTLLAFRYQVLDKPAVYGPLLCPVTYDSSGTARVIRLIYQAIILFVSVCIGLTELVFGYSLYQSSANIQGAQGVLYLAIVTCFGVISDSIAFLVYYIVNDPTAYFSIVLIFTEVIPIFIIIIRISSQQVKRNLSKASQSSTRKLGTTTSPPSHSHSPPSRDSFH